MSVMLTSPLLSQSPGQGGISGVAWTLPPLQSLFVKSPPCASFSVTLLLVIRDRRYGVTAGCMEAAVGQPSAA